jgi:hypothetical protein
MVFYLPAKLQVFHSISGILPDHFSSNIYLKDHIVAEGMLI